MEMQGDNFRHEHRCQGQESPECLQEGERFHVAELRP